MAGAIGELLPRAPNRLETHINLARDGPVRFGRIGDDGRDGAVEGGTHYLCRLDRPPGDAIVGPAGAPARCFDAAGVALQQRAAMHQPADKLACAVRTKGQPLRAELSPRALIGREIAGREFVEALAQPAEREPGG